MIVQESRMIIVQEGRMIVQEGRMIVEWLNIIVYEGLWRFMKVYEVFDGL